nr:MAG TPA: hypothetical protein [Caudoviricetes sp.]
MHGRPAERPSGSRVYLGVGCAFLGRIHAR